MLLASLLLAGGHEGGAAEWTFLNFAGTPGKGGQTDGRGAEARFDYPSGLAVDSLGRVWVADANNHCLRRIDPDGMVTTAVGAAGQPGDADGPAVSARLNGPSGVAVDLAGRIWIADANNHVLRRLEQDGTVKTVAGQAGQPGGTDGVGPAARFHTPSAVAIDAAGNAYVADFGNHTVRTVTAAGAVTTLAGSAGESGSADGFRTASRWNHPSGVAVDSSTNLWVADYGNHTVRKIAPDGWVITVAGAAGQPGGADGLGEAARFSSPAGVAADPAGDVYVADSWNHALRKLEPTGRVSTVGGMIGQPGSREGTSGSARFYSPQAVAVDASSRLWLADSYNYRVLRTVTACPDVPIIDTPVGPPNVPRQLDTAPRTASAWGWTVLRRPAGSSADFSAHRLRNPVFVPDAPGGYEFALAATNAAAEISLRTVAFEAVARSAPLQVTRGLEDLTVYSGQSGAFAVFVSGTAPFQYRWTKDGAALPQETNYLLSLARTQPADAGTYTVTVTDATGSSATASARLTLLSPTLVRGVVTDGLTGLSVSDVSIRWGRQTVQSDSRGQYEVAWDDLGAPRADFDADRRTGAAPLTVRFFNRSVSTEFWLDTAADKAGYLGYSDEQARLQVGETNRYDFTLYPVLRGTLRFVLTWGERPRDLDAHLLTPPIDGVTYEIGYADGKRGASNAPPFSLLDRDSKAGFGPEIVTVYRLFPGSYRFFVHNYQEEQGDSGALRESSAVVQVIWGDQLAKVIPVPSRGDGTFWEVCSVDGSTGEIVELNRLGSAKPAVRLPEVPSVSSRLQPREGGRVFPVRAAARTDGGGALRYLWDFGDGTVSTEPKPPPKVYSSPGSYTVSLSVTDSDGKLLTATKPAFVVTTAAAPSIDVLRLGDRVRLSWPTSSPEARLEACDDLRALSWYPIDMQFIAIGGSFRAEVPAQGNRFFRLKIP